MNDSQPLIRLDGVRKIFYTDEVETHALAGVHAEQGRIRGDHGPVRLR